MDSNTTSVFMQHQQLLMRRPQSLFDPSIAVIPMQQGGQSLPSHQQQFPHFVQPTKFATTNNHQSNTVKHPDANAQQQSLSASRGGGRSSPYPHAAVILAEKHNQEQQHPQIWCGKGQAEPIASKHIYNYAQRAESEEKTPMCCVAELARFNKLRHEYVLLDESGPAHKKKFTVRLRICHGQEFEGSGPSIKKAQQAAAQQALNSTTLSRPPQLRGVKRSVRKDETSNPVLLLNSVVSQLGFNVHYREELIRQPANAASPFKETNPPNFSSFSPVQFPPQLCYVPPALPSTTPSCSSIQLLPPNRGLASLLDLALVGPLPAALPFPPFQPVNGFSSLLSPPFFSLPSPSLFLPGLPPSPLKGPSLLGPSPMQNISYKVTITLGLDSSEHIGNASNLPAAKQKAATLALAHLKPDLERFKRDRDREEPHVPSSAKQQEDQSNQLQNCQLYPICSPSASPSSTDIPSSESTTPESGEIGGVNWEDDADGAVETEGMGKETAESQPQQRREREEEEGVARPPTRRKTKSVVSQIHECALRLKMNIEFEVLAERGEPHNRVYILRCRLTGPAPSTGPSANKEEAREFVAEGRGPSKKAAKQAVCQQLIGQVRHLIDDDPIHLATQIVRQIAGAEGATAPQLRGRGGPNHAVGGGQANGGRELAKRRTIIKDRKIDPEYGHHINPVSRLIQVMQAHQEKEPHFQLVAEQGLNRHKEFTVAVQCMGMQEQGTGPNKKLAKRAAAEAMLAKIGYVKPMPQPGKSLLKKKTDQNGGEGLLDFMEIGHFNAAELAEENSGWTGTDGEGQQQKEKWTEGRPDTLHTFADVEQAMRQEEGRGEESACSPPLVTKQHSEEEEGEAGQSPKSPSPPGEGEDGQPGAVRSQHRRVTFSEHVSACPPPEDSNYPAASVAPLKSELGGRLKRRSRDSQRMLSEEETRRMAEMAKLFLGWRAAERERRGFVDLATGEWTGQVDRVEALGADMEALGLSTDSGAALLASPPPPVQLQPGPIPSSPLLPANKFTNALPDVPGPPEEPSNCSAKLALIGAKPFLGLLAKQFKFSVAYSDFPKTSNAADKEQCFTLLTLGLSKPIVCHGSGPTEADAHNDAAFNAIRTQLSQLD